MEKQNLMSRSDEEVGRLFKEILALAENRFNMARIDNTVKPGIPPRELAEVANRYLLGNSIEQVFVIAIGVYLGGNLQEVKKESLRISIAEDRGVSPDEIIIAIEKE